MKKAKNLANMGFLLVLIFCILSFALSFGHIGKKNVFADDNNLPVVTVQSKTVHRGQTFSIDVSLENNLGLTSLCLVLEKANFDSSVFTLVDVIRKDGLSNLTYTQTNTDTDFGYDVDSFRMLWDGTSQDQSNGTLVSLVFESNIEAEIGDYQIKLDYDISNTNFEYGVSQQIEIIDSTISLIKGEFTVNYLNYDGTVLYSKDYNENDIPSYVGEAPVKPEDDCYTYTFSGWKGVVSDDINTINYQAQFSQTPKTYQLFYYVADYENGEIGEFNFYYATELDYNEVIDILDVPQRVHYVFHGWYIDDVCTTPFSMWKMPSRDLTLYGY